MPLLVLLIVFFGIGAWPISARADDLADEADLQFQLGAQAYRTGNYHNALEHFLASNRLVPNTNAIFNVARAYERLELYPEAYRAFDSALALEPREDNRHSIEAELQRIRPKVALMRVRSQPPGATIYLDRKDLGPRGTTPRVLAVNPGEYTVILELAGHHSVQSNRTPVGKGQEVELALDLSPLRGVVQLLGDHATRVFIGSLQTAPACSLPCSLSHAAGNQSLFFARPGYRTEETVVTVNPERAIRLRPELKPLLGVLVVNTDEPGARVEVDGKVIGFSPMLTETSVGPHRVVVALAGYKSVSSDVTVQNESETRLNLDLTRSDRVIAASRRNEDVEDAPGSISLVNREELKALAYPTLAEALKGRPGAYVSDDRAYVSLGIRGLNRLGSYGNRTVVLQDGVATNDNWIGSSYVGYDAMTDLGDVERVELVRGPGSVLYGTSAFSGVVNVVTRGVTKNGVEASISNSYSDVARARVRGDLVLGSGATLWTSLAGAKSQGTDFFIPEYAGVTPPGGSAGVARNADGFDTGTARGRFEWHWFTASYFLHTHSKHFPGAQFASIFGDSRARQTDTRGFVELKAEPTLGRNTNVLSRVYLNRYTFSGEYPHPQADGGLELDTFRGHWVGAEQRVTHQITSKATFTIGGEFQWHFDVTETARNDNGYALNDAGANSKPFTVAAAYMALDGQIGPRTRVSLGTRLDHYSTFGDSANPRLAVIFRPWQAGTWKLIVGRAFRAPSVYELFYNDGGTTQIANPNLKPEVIYSAETEYTHQIAPTVATTWSLWGNTVHNLIDTQTTGSNDGHALAQFVNTSQPIVAYGSDVSIRRDWRHGWMLEANYGWQHLAFLQSAAVTDLLALATDPQRQHVSNYPAQNVGIRVVAPIVAKQLLLGTRWTYVDARWTRYDPSRAETQVQTDPAVLWDFVLSGEEERFGVGYHIGAYNLFNWRYSLPVGFEFTQRTMPQLGRSVIAGLTWQR
jgi:outer membrane receptor protein involved in Fe transport